MDFIKKRVNLILTCVIVILGAFGLHKTNQGPDYVVYVDQISKKFVKEMKKEHDLICVGSGGSMPHNVKRITFLLRSNRRVSIEEARLLETQCVERLRELINSHNKIRPFLAAYPCSSEMADVRISFYDERGEKFSQEKGLCYVTNIKGKIIYGVWNEEANRFIDCFEEPDEEALRKVGLVHQ